MVPSSCAPPLPVQTHGGHGGVDDKQSGDDHHSCLLPLRAVPWVFACPDNQYQQPGQGRDGHHLNDQVPAFAFTLFAPLFGDG